MSSNSAAENQSKTDNKGSSWVQFEEDETGKTNIPNVKQHTEPAVSSLDAAPEYQGAVINPETIHVKLDRSISRSVSPETQPDPPKRKLVKVNTSDTQHYSGAVINTESVHINIDRNSLSSPISELSQDTQGTRGVANNIQDEMRTVDLRDISNGRQLNNSRGTTGENTVIRQGFGEY